MLGLLGTVVGMMKTFFEIANGDFSGASNVLTWRAAWRKP